MKRPSNELIAHGVVGGIIAGLVVALWFLIVDSIAGYPFRTPAALAFGLYVAPVIEPTLRSVVAYSVIHLGVYAGLGVGAAWMMDALHAAPRLLLGVFWGIVVQELVFYTGLFLSGLPPSEVVPWKHVIGANLLSGLVLMTYLHHAERVELPLGFAALKGHPHLTRGLITGLVGAAVVAAWFLFLDLASGQPFRTPAALGSALLFGASNAEATHVNLGVVAAYTVVHVIVFAVAGFVFVTIAEQVERSPSFLLLAGMTLILLEGIVVASLALGAQWVLGALGVWSTIVANVLAVMSMGWYVWRTHPTLRQRMRGVPAELRV